MNVCIKSTVYEIVREDPIRDSGWTMLYLKRPNGNRLYLGRRDNEGKVENLVTRIKAFAV